ncbi:lonely Cys domain-containing protein [Streptomyces sp. NPDC048279]|uniref:lonely Cys domain-containing protein n=1 Tax=Streptomyces sp. NPDC048279 TaxID=3154714 RepID=UPI003427441D
MTRDPERTNASPGIGKRAPAVGHAAATGADPEFINGVCVGGSDAETHRAERPFDSAGWGAARDAAVAVRSEPAPDRSAEAPDGPAFDVRRFDFGGQSFADVTLHVGFTNAVTVSQQEREGMWERITIGVDEAINAPGRIVDGDRQHVTVLPAVPGVLPHLSVELAAPGSGRLMTPHLWRTDAAPADYARHIAKLLDLDTSHIPADVSSGELAAPRVLPTVAAGVIHEPQQPETWPRPVDPRSPVDTARSPGANSDSAQEPMPDRLFHGISPVPGWENEESPHPPSQAPDHRPVPGQAAGPYASADALLGDLLMSAVPPDRVPAPAPGTALLGPDLFRMRQPSSPPEFMAGYDFSSLSTRQIITFINLLDMVEQTPSRWAMDPRRIPQAEEGWVTVRHRSGAELTEWAPGNVPPLPEVAELPGLIHSIWLGGPLRDDDMGYFRDNLRRMARRFHGAARIVLWTDVPRFMFEQAKEVSRYTDSAELAEVRDMLKWARQASVVLLNVDEVFNAESPMFLHEFYRSETVKQVGLGYAAASDILRAEIVHRFGGIYSDGGDNQIRDPSALMDQVDSTFGFAVDNVDDQIGNSLLAMPRGHPVALIYLEVIRSNYGKNQRGLMREHGNASPDSFLTAEGMIRRNSTTRRTGPHVMEGVAQRLGIWVGDLPGVASGVEIGSAQSWISQSRSRIDEEALPRRTDVLRTAQYMVQALVRDMYNREGDLHLTLVDPVLRGNRQREMIWDAVIRFFAFRSDLSSKVTTVTVGREEPGGTRRVMLPPATVALLDFRTPAASGEQTRHWLGEYQTPVRLRPPAAGLEAFRPAAWTPDHDAPAGLKIPIPAQLSQHPILRAEWWDRRTGAAVARLSTEVFDPSSRPLDDGRPGALGGRRTVVRADIRRIQARTEGWVRDLTVVLPVRCGEGFTPGSLSGFQAQLNGLLDEHVNAGYTLPISGDQLHVSVELVPASWEGPTVELTRVAVPGRSDQLHWRLHEEDAALALAVQDLRVLLHEVLHYTGVTDRYYDPNTLFRDKPGKAYATGPMADVAEQEIWAGLAADYLVQIESATSTGPVLRDHPLTASEAQAATDAATGGGETSPPFDLPGADAPTSQAPAVARGGTGRAGRMVPWAEGLPGNVLAGETRISVTLPVGDAPTSQDSPSLALLGTAAVRSSARVALLAAPLLAADTRIRGRGGLSGGRNWTQSGISGLATDEVHLYGPDGRGGLRRVKTDPAGWRTPGTPDPYVVVADGSHDHVLVSVGAGKAPVRLTGAELAGILERDPDLAVLPAAVSVVLLVPDAGGQGLDLPRMLAHRLGRTVWAASGDARPHSRSWWQEHGIALTARDLLLPVGQWIPSHPDGPGPMTGGDDVITALDGTTFRDSDIHTRTIVSTDHQLLGRHAMDDTELERDGEHRYARVHKVTAVYHVLPLPLRGTAGVEDVTPEAGVLRYHFDAHGLPGKVILPLRNGEKKAVSGSEVGRMLARRPSVQEHARRNPGDGSIWLESCFSAAPSDGHDKPAQDFSLNPVVWDPLQTLAVGQHVANHTRLRTTGVTRPQGIVPTLAADMIRLSETSVRGLWGRVVTFVPEPSEAELDGLAGVAGLHAGAGPASQEVRSRTLRLVRALRLIFGAEVEADRDLAGGTYRQLLGGIGALEIMRAADPTFSSITAFTLELLRQVAAGDRRQSGAHLHEPDQVVYRAVLERARRAPGGITLTRFASLPLMHAAARSLVEDQRSMDERAVGVLRLEADHPVGDSERQGLYWAVVKAHEVIAEAVDAAALTARVLHLDSGIPGDAPPAEELLWTLAGAAAAGREVTSLSAAAAFHLEELGAFAQDTRIVNDHGELQGRLWSGGGPFIDRLDTAVVRTVMEQSDGVYQIERVDSPPWPADTGSWTVSAQVGGDASLICVPGGSIRHVPNDEFAELLTHDHDLSCLPLNVPVVLVVPHAATGGLPEAVAQALGRQVWAHSGDIRLVGGPGMGLAVVGRPGQADLGQWKLVHPPGHPSGLPLPGTAPLPEVPDHVTYESAADQSRSPGRSARNDAGTPRNVT